MAEGIATDVFPHKLDFEISVSSAGSSAIEGMPASSLSVHVARKRGIDVCQHRTKLLTRTSVKEADLIVTMGPKHRDTVGVIELSALEYTYVITDFCDEASGGIPDPIGGNEEMYEEAYDLIRRCVEQMAEKLEDFDGWKA